MKALVYTAPRRLDYREAPEPAIREGDALIRVEAVGICGSDMHAFLGHDDRRPAPLILGHEAAGTILEGAGAGKRVTVNPLVACRECRDCLEGRDNICQGRQIISMPPREGAFAELLSMPTNNLVEIPDHVRIEHAALAEPLACGWHAVRLAANSSHMDPGDAACLVFGGGAIGLGAALALKARGAASIQLAETSAERRATIDRIDGIETYDPLSAGAPEPGSADIVVDGVGVEATRAAASTVARHGGIIVHIGLGSATGGLDVRRMTLQEITFIGAYTYTSQDFKEAASALFDGRFGELGWIERRPLSEGATAFADILSGRLAAPKIVLTPGR